MNRLRMAKKEGASIPCSASIHWLARNLVESGFVEDVQI
jgi:ribosomal protein S8